MSAEGTSETLKLYALVRSDLGMPPGKLASQAGHAFLGAFLQANMERRADYSSPGIGTKICLRVTNLTALLRVYDAARLNGLPAFLVEDTGRNTTFNGLPTLSAVGIGPIFPREAVFLKRFPLHP